MARKHHQPPHLHRTGIRRGIRACSFCLVVLLSAVAVCATSCRQHSSVQQPATNRDTQQRRLDPGPALMQLIIRCVEADWLDHRFDFQTGPVHLRFDDYEYLLDHFREDGRVLIVAELRDEVAQAKPWPGGLGPGWHDIAFTFFIPRDEWEEAVHEDAARPQVWEPVVKDAFEALRAAAEASGDERLTDGSGRVVITATDGNWIVTYIPPGAQTAEMEVLEPFFYDDLAVLVSKRTGEVSVYQQESQDTPDD